MVKFDKKAYQREYMARQRARLPTSRRHRMEQALNELDALLAPNTKGWSLNMRRIISEALNPPKTPIKDTGDE